MKTYIPSAAAIERKWYVVDAEGQTVGRLAAEVAKVLRPSRQEQADLYSFSGLRRLRDRDQRFQNQGHRQEDD